MDRVVRRDAEQDRFLIDGSSKWTDPPPVPVRRRSGRPLRHDVASERAHTRGEGPAIRRQPCDQPVGDGDDRQRQEPTATAAATAASSSVVTSSIANGATLTGSLAWTATPTGTTVSSVDFLIDGTVKWTEHVSPYVFNGDGNKLDTATLSNGAHTLALQAHAADGRTATASSAVTVANGSTTPPPPSAFAVTSSIANGACSPARCPGRATPSGTTVSSVDFLIDGTVKWTDSRSRIQFNGDPGSTLDTTTLSDGAHTLCRRGARRRRAHGDRNQLGDGHERRRVSAAARSASPRASPTVPRSAAR